MPRASEKRKAVRATEKATAHARPKQPRIVEIVQRLGRMIPEEELRRIPKDLAEQHDHYIYGTPKK